MNDSVNKKATIACDACKRRKGKCIGSGATTCSWCLANQIECTFSFTNQKRGPKKRKNDDRDDAVEREREKREQYTLTIDKREMGMISEIEISGYMEQYLRYLDPLFTMLGQRDHGAHVVLLLHPRSPSQHIIRYAASAMMAKLLGLKERSNSLISSAVAISGQAFCDMSLDGMIAFMLMGTAGTSCVMNHHFFNIALSIFKVLHPSSIPVSIRQFLTVATVMLNGELEDYDKLLDKLQAVFLKKSQQIVTKTNIQQLAISISRLRLKIFSHMRCSDDFMRVDIVAALACKVVYSEIQRESLLSEVKDCQALAVLSFNEETDKIIGEYVELLLGIFEVFIEWRTGNVEKALCLAIHIASICSIEKIRFCTPERQRFDVNILLIMSIFLYENHQPALANKLQQIAQSFYLIIGDETSHENWQTTSERLADFAHSKYSSSSSSFSSSLPSSFSSSSSSLTNDNLASLSVMINNSISLLSQSIPPGGLQLLYAQDLHMFYNSLSNFIPLFPSPLKVDSVFSSPPPSSSPPPPSFSSSSPSPSSSPSQDNCISSTTSSPTVFYPENNLYIPTKENSHPNDNEPLLNFSVSFMFLIFHLLRYSCLITNIQTTAVNTTG